jgi:hypothetical protein
MACVGAPAPGRSGTLPRMLMPPSLPAAESRAGGAAAPLGASGPFFQAWAAYQRVGLIPSLLSDP